MSEAGPSLAVSEIPHRLGPYRLTAATEYGPRLVSMRRDDSPEIFVSLEPEASVDHPSGRPYRLRGGHRLWVSPEEPTTTYAPDDHPCDVLAEENAVTILAPPDVAGFEKSMRVDWNGTSLSVEHTVRWVGEHPIEASAWSLTQLPPGGVAILPVGGAGDGSPLQADRSLVVWPYTDLADTRLSWRPSSVLIDMGPGGPIKLGSGPVPGAVGYLKDGYLFVKRFDSSDVEYPDRGAAAQIYGNDVFCELESLGPLTRLEPGDETRHTEVWEVAPCADIDTAVQTVVT